MIGAVLTVNLAASVIFIVNNRKERAGAFLMFLIFLAVPLFGILMYYIPIWMFSALHNRNVYNTEDLMYAGKSESYVKRPDVEKEMNAIPVKEALVVNDPAEKRRFILDIIRTDMNHNYKAILPALRDNDSETSHYAAAMAMEVQSRQKKVINGLEERLNAGEPVEEELLEAYAHYAESGVLTSRDMRDIKERYIRLMRIEQGNRVLGKRFYIIQADYLAEQKQYGEALSVLKGGMEREPCEELYDKLLELYYIMGRKKEFWNTIQEIRDSHIVLSPERLDRLRFWMRKGE